MAEQNREVLLKVENLCQFFRSGNYVNKAVNNVSFDIYKGEVFGLVGESGCGKTTTGRSIIKIYDITSGSVYFKGQRIVAGLLSYKEAIQNSKKELKAEIKTIKAEKTPDAKERIEAKKAEYAEIIAKNKIELKKAKHDNRYSDRDYANHLKSEVKKKYEEDIAKANSPKEIAAIKAQFKKDYRIAGRTKLITKIQMIFQDPIASLNPRMTVKEIIAEGLVIRGMRDKEQIDELVYKVLETVGLVREHAGRYPHEFSGGQRQRIGVARSVIMQPELIIADEPVSALDVSIQAQVINLLNELRADLGLSILFIAHDLSVVKYFSDRIGVMYFGKMVELADADELFKNPMHPYTRSLLSAIPLPDPEYEKTRKRITYVPLRDHDYSTSQPTFREVTPGHFVLCNDVEEQRYKEEIAGNAQ